LRKCVASPHIRYRLTLASFGAFSRCPCCHPTAINWLRSARFANAISISPLRTAVNFRTTPIIVASFRKITVGDNL
jgi:hypothetical protein